MVQANTEAESLKPLTKSVQAATAEGPNWKRELKWLQTHRCIPHTITYRSLFGHQPRTKLLEVPHQSTRPDLESVSFGTKKPKATMKKHGDKWFRTSELHLSDVILVTQPKLNKISRRYNPRPMVITDRKGSMVTECHPKGLSKTEKLLRLPTLTTKHDPDGRHIAAATRII